MHTSKMESRAIRDLQDQAQKQLLHAKSHWPKVIHLALWPFVLRNAVHLHNTLPTQDWNWSLLKQFSSINVGASLTHTNSKWNPLCPLGVNLGPSPFHACNVYLVLNLLMRLVSLQFHVSFHDFFVTIRYDPFTTNMPTTWQQLAGLIQVLDIIEL